MNTTYKVTASDPSNGLFVGQIVNPYYEDSIEMIITGSQMGVDHHIKKNGQYFNDHFAKEEKAV
ncbi:hypothetical protein NYE59_23285 [Paenibacillus sp. FSL L8-0323]|uniref:hypothetical protein n=1 Tax=Paenibacillus sp. FSL L8-0323 TaxID=2975330 RepID=UPI0030FC6B0A